MSSSDIITVIRDPSFHLGKQFSREVDGTVTKKAAVSISLGIAVQHHVPDIQALQRLLDQVSEDAHAAVVNATFPLIPLETEFLTLSEAAFLERGEHGQQSRWHLPRI